MALVACHQRLHAANVPLFIVSFTMVTSIIGHLHGDLQVPGHKWCQWEVVRISGLDHQTGRFWLLPQQTWQSQDSLPPLFDTGNPKQASGLLQKTTAIAKTNQALDISQPEERWCYLTVLCDQGICDWDLNDWFFWFSPSSTEHACKIWALQYKRNTLLFPFVFILDKPTLKGKKNFTQLKVRRINSW